MKQRAKRKTRVGRELTSIVALKRELSKREAELKRLERLEKSLRARLATIERQKVALTGAADTAPTARKSRRARRAVKRSINVSAKIPVSAVPAKKARAGKPSKVSRRKTASIRTLVVEIAREHPKGVTIGKIVELLLKRGVKTKSKNFRKMIAIAVAKNPGVKRIRKGVYVARG